MSEKPQVLIPFDKREALSLRQAANIAGKSESTLRSWCTEFEIGRRVASGHWQVSHPALLMLLDGDDETRRCYLAGERQAANVAAYFARAGLTPQRV
jgi:hypothetical protein